jgi:pyrroline-5-carboxylate reductase
MKTGQNNYNMTTIGFVGAGNMAEAILQGVIAARLFMPTQVFVSDIRPERLQVLNNRYGVTPVAHNQDLAKKADIVVLAVKPYQLAEALADVSGHLRTTAVVVSVIAGKRVSDITKILGDIPVVRVMPNTPALLNEGASALFANGKAQDILPQITNVFACVGQALEVDRESMIDAVTAVSGSGPAYFYLLMESMIEAGIKLGLDPETATTLVLQTAKGAALLAQEANRQEESPTDLTKKVATPGGTTEAALTVFREGKFGYLVEQALTRARDRSQELSSGSM